MYDISVWSIRDIVRQAEKDRSRPTRDANHFTLLHETARHAIHSSETLNVTDAIEKKAAEYSTKHLSFQLRMLQNLLLRSQSNKERLQNEIALAVFSMSFFDFVPGQDGQKGQWLVSEHFWIYWAFAIPLTCLTIGIWATRQKWSRVHK
ncbi:uncharacterized protein J4E79_005823 [Alternaria viburni]|uniref:uncharacterized protein n=1 Tax=Alternaria viburni TaxID=566460 RepID=UPI0020C1CF69|nr:uncharacterized protein J4E79_005823 [Alternaria viburni]KAI4660021.1 hypothetical protein J4E79_005823 [Alternaria viburni]